MLGTSNIAESLRGYYTKYDCSSADLNPIGGINKSDIKAFLKWSAAKMQIDVLNQVAQATPTAELKPSADGKPQNDEEDMGFTYDELDRIGKLRKIHKSGPVAMFRRLIFLWPHLQPQVIADKVKSFFIYYSQNRHKSTILPPSYHAESYGTDDNRFDLRPFLYDTSWEYQFKQIDRELLQLTQNNKNKPKL